MGEMAQLRDKVTWETASTDSGIPLQVLGRQDGEDVIEVPDDWQFVPGLQAFPRQIVGAVTTCRRTENESVFVGDGMGRGKTRMGTLSFGINWQLSLSTMGHEVAPG
jgi:hypothetical protein